MQRDVEIEPLGVNQKGVIQSNIIVNKNNYLLSRNLEWSQKRGCFGTYRYLQLTDNKTLELIQKELEGSKDGRGCKWERGGSVGHSWAIGGGGLRFFVYN